MKMIPGRKKIDMDTIQELKAIKWVADAEKSPDENSFIIHTRPKMLKFQVDHKIYRVSPNIDEFSATLKMKKTMVLDLPEYRILLQKGDFWVALMRKPMPNTKWFGITPQYHDRKEIGTWNKWYVPCYGESDRQYDLRSSILDYKDALTWKEKANIVAIFLQSAHPHYGRDWWTACFAYRLGLLGEEIIDKKQEKAAWKTYERRQKDWAELQRNLQI